MGDDVTRGDVPASGGSDEDVAPRDLCGLEELLEVADEVTETTRTWSGIAAPRGFARS
jgi:hypothetical protein